MAGQPRDAASGRRVVEAWIGAGLGVLLIGVAFWWLLESVEAAPWQPTKELWRRFLIVSTVFLFGLLITGVVYCFRANEFVRPYVQGLGVIAKSTVLWVMFLASMTASVFFSFDYHFNSIFREKLRKETAESRAQEKLPKVMNDLSSKVRARSKTEKDALFTEEAWKKYEQQLDRVKEVANRSPELVRIRDEQDSAKRQERAAELERQLATLTIQVKPLEQRKVDIDERLEKSNSQHQKIQETLEEQREEVRRQEQALAQAKAKAKMEESGTSGPGLTGKIGRKSGWNNAMKAVKAIEGSLAGAKEKLDTTNNQLKQIEKEINVIQADSAELEPRLRDLKSEETIARGKLQEVRKAGSTIDTEADVRRHRRQLDVQKTDFGDTPTAALLKNLQSSCTELKGIGMSVQADDAGRIDCDPKEMSSKLSKFIADQDRTSAFINECAKAENFTSLKETQSMVEFASNCLQKSGLPHSEIDTLYAVVREIRDMRDDTAQSFIVTLNAFRERNWLAYLALAIAITIDLLILFAGLFGATTVTGPLEKGGLRDIAARVRRLPPENVRAALAALRDNRFTEADLSNPHIKEIVTLGFDRQVPGEPAGSHLVVKEEDEQWVRYRLHLIYIDELYELMQRAQQRGVIEPEIAEKPSATPEPTASADSYDDQAVVRIFTAPRRSASSG
jgi:predicted  nucleic acid-binding Zn-ribbon protein